MIPTYKQSEVLPRAIESVLAQDYPQLEVIVADDCSPDGTEDIAGRYSADARLKYFRNERNFGRVANYRRNLFERVTGAWVLNLDGDDYFYDNHAISNLMTATLEYPNEPIVAVLGVQETRNLSLQITALLPPSIRAGLYNGIEIFRDWPRTQFGHLATLYRADLAREIDYYRMDTISSDWESILRLILHGKVVVANAKVGVWNIHGNNISGSADIKSWIRDFEYIESAAQYARDRGVADQEIGLWRRRMIRFHSRSIWDSAFPLSSKLSELLPYLLENYPFALTVLLDPKFLTKNLLRIHPVLYSKIAELFRRRKRGGKVL
jgi:glycosyltransferase involved in cell wall biosynthesis